MTFNQEEEWHSLAGLGFMQRAGIQYHWENPGYAAFDDFLAALKQSKRKNIKQVPLWGTAEKSASSWQWRLRLRGGCLCRNARPLQRQGSEFDACLETSSSQVIGTSSTNSTATQQTISGDQPTSHANSFRSWEYPWQSMCSWWWLKRAMRPHRWLLALSI